MTTLKNVDGPAVLGPAELIATSTKVDPVTAKTAVTVPAGLVTATTEREGKAGQQWLDRLPGLVTAACNRWDCIIDGPPIHGQVALVVPVQHPRGPATLKISFPHPGNLGEAAALRTFAGNGAVELFEADDTGLELVLERCLPLTLADHAATMEDYPVEEAIEVAGDLARRLAVEPIPGITRLADNTPAWTDELLGQVARLPDALPSWAVEQALETIQLLGADETTTMLHGDLHFGNIMWAHREPWLAIDPKGWTGTAAFDAFTVILGRRENLDPGDGLYDTVEQRIYRFAAAALVHPDLALACCQARAVSAYLYQLQVPEPGFDLEFAHTLALSGAAPDQHRPGPRCSRERDLAILGAGFETGFWDDRGVPAPWPGGVTMDETEPPTGTEQVASAMTAPRTGRAASDAQLTEHSGGVRGLPRVRSRSSDA